MIKVVLDTNVLISALLFSGDKVLYSMRNSASRTRDIPGGTVEYGETLLNTLRRELKEELNYTLSENPGLLHAFTYFAPERSFHRVYVVYLMDVPNEILFMDHENKTETQFIWIHKDEIKEQKFEPGLEEALLKASRYRR